MTIFKTLMLLGALQGFILSGILFFSTKNVYANRILGTLILLISLACLNLYLFYIPQPPFLVFILNFIPLVIIMPIGPLLYYYVRAVTQPSAIDLRHFWPTIIDCGAQLIAAVYVIGAFFGIVTSPPGPWASAIDTYNVYSDIPRWCAVSIYLWLAARHLKTCNLKQERLLWMQQFLRTFLSFQLIWLLYLIPYVIPAYTGWVLDTFDWYPVYIPLVVMIYFLGIKGILMPERAILAEGLAEHVIPRLRMAMEDDRLYLNPALNLSLLSTHTSLAPKTISAVLNQHLQTNFNDFINSYRISAFKQKAADPAYGNLTIMGLALEAGFNSLPTFQRAFKKQTGMSPGEFINAQIRI